MRDLDFNLVLSLNALSYFKSEYIMMTILKLRGIILLSNSGFKIFSHKLR